MTRNFFFADNCKMYFEKIGASDVECCDSDLCNTVQDETAISQGAGTDSSTSGAANVQADMLPLASMVFIAVASVVWC